MSYRLKDGLQFMRSLPDKSVDGIFTDPPWGRGPNIVGQKEASRLIAAMFSECPRILKPGARVLVWMGIRFIDIVIAANYEIGFSNDRVIARTKLEYRWSIFCCYMPPRYFANFEAYFDQILFFSLPGDSWPSKYRGKCLPQLYYKASTGKPDTFHPCARPIETIKDILAQWFLPGEYVIDPFAGSDTMGVACRELNIKYDSCEIDPAMYKTGVERNKQGNLFEAGSL